MNTAVMTLCILGCIALALSAIRTAQSEAYRQEEGDRRHG